MAVWSKIQSSQLIKPSRFDSEYFRPEFLDIRRVLDQYPPVGYYMKELIHPAEFKRVYSEHGTTVVRTQNVRPLSIEIENNEVFIPDNVAAGLVKNKIFFGDILITRTGANFGQTSLFTGERTNAIVTSHSFILRLNKEVRSPYVALFLNTKHGRKLIDQGMYGSSQPEIAPKFIKDIPIPRLDEKTEEKLSNTVLKSYELKKQSKDLYNQAHRLLEDALGLSKIELKEGISFVSSFKDVVSSHRLDSNHFKPKFDQLLGHIKANFDFLHIGASVTLNRRGIQPTYIPEGSKRVVTSQHITSTHLDYDNFERTSDYHYVSSPEAHIRYGDILTYTTGAYVGQTNVYLDTEPALASNHVNIIRLKSSEIDPTYLAFVLNSTVGKLQTEKYIRGSAQAELYPNDISKYIIPILDNKTMTCISQNVKASLKAKQESKELLEQAKQEVENLIEQKAKQA